MSITSWPRDRIWGSVPSQVPHAYQRRTVNVALADKLAIEDRYDFHDQDQADMVYEL